MSELAYKYFLNKFKTDKIGVDEDPYFEPIPDAELGYWHKKGDKRKKKVPKHLPPKEYKILDNIRKEAYRLDLQLSMCGFRFGWAGVIGIFPWVGDCICLYFALSIVRQAETVEGGLPATLRARMMANVIFDFGIGLIPIVGDLVNVIYKCNSRNFLLLDHYLLKKYPMPTGTETAAPHHNSLHLPWGHKQESQTTKPASGQQQQAPPAIVPSASDSHDHASPPIAHHVPPPVVPSGH